MKVLLVRSSFTAADASEATRAQVYLSREGRQLARALGAALAQHGETLDALLTTPDVAAVQTAELVAERLDYLGEVRTLSGASAVLAPHALTALVTSAGASVLVVGPEPWLSSLGAFLVGSPAFPPTPAGGAALIERGAPSWMYDPVSRTFATLRTH